MRLFRFAFLPLTIALMAGGPSHAATYDITGVFKLSAETAVPGEGTATPERGRSAATVAGFDSALGTLESVTVAVDYRHDGLIGLSGTAPEGTWASGVSSFQTRVAGRQIEPTSLPLFTMEDETGRGGRYVRGLTFSGSDLDAFRGDSVTLDFIGLAGVRLVCGEAGACGAATAFSRTAVAGEWMVRYGYSGAEEARQTVAAVPLPAALTLLPLGLLALGAAARPRQRFGFRS